ncbi:MAG: hypothetical protein AAB308_06870 [Nitrospirota bacterium]|jgi:hypothetical protein
MKRKKMTPSQSKRKVSNKMSIEEKLHLMGELYWSAAQDGSLERYRREREKGVKEVRRRWQLLRERLLPKHPAVAR